MNSKDYDKLVNHPLQSFEWGEFRKKTGVKVIQENRFQLTIHKIPYLSWTIGYFPKGDLPDKKLIDTLKKIGRENNCIFIQLEPNIKVGRGKLKMEKLILNSQFSILNSFHPLFTRYTFVLDLTKSEEEILSGMHQKTRYNIRVAEKHGIKIVEDNSNEAFEAYLKLTQETTKRQNFYAHTPKYHKLLWQTLKTTTKDQRPKTDKLVAHLLLAKYKKEILVAWILFTFKDTLYYPYGASSSLHRETMASNLMMWEAIKLGKRLGLKKFDMWGAMGPSPDPKDPRYGFHRFKQGYGGRLIEFVGSYDLVINPILYQLYKISDKIRWTFLKSRQYIA